ncbi:hypothetical protein L6164_015269 [Bauhinia variegata]|uniref:Uncharacterized protein n=1 Tax=Bauhinia variegata TaxID=167791 RepID=A0ACB9NK71_BAUVA|nr:hypothetical protein L6164_015269 [Bauhinia variegata]
MHKAQRERGGESFDIQVLDGEEGVGLELELEQTPCQFKASFPKWNFSSMKLFTRFRKILMRLIFSPAPAVGSSASASTSNYSSKRGSSSERYDPPKTSCSSYYSSYSHYNEAIADCIEFINRSAQDGILEPRKSDVV